MLEKQELRLAKRVDSPRASLSSRAQHIQEESKENQHPQKKKQDHLHNTNYISDPFVKELVINDKYVIADFDKTRIKSLIRIRVQGRQLAAIIDAESTLST